MERRLREIARVLRDDCPTAMGYPVKVRRTRQVGKLFGWTTLSGKRGQCFLIVIRHRVVDRHGKVHDVTESDVCETLMHEWAHAMAWTPTHSDLTDHDAHWGVCYSKTYAAVVED